MGENKKIMILVSLLWLFGYYDNQKLEDFQKEEIINSINSC